MRTDPRSRPCNHEVLCIFALLMTAGSPGYCQDPQHPPNVVIVFTDDQGYGDTGRYGASGFTTPNLDRLASEGVLFTSFYVSEAVCSASRASLLTGCYSERVGIQGALGPWSTVGLNAEEETIASMLRKQGYATGIFGKWHLGHTREFLPLQHGFDEYVGLPYSNDMWPVGYDGNPQTKGQKSFYPPLPLLEGNRQIGVITSLGDQDGLTTLYTERAVAFIRKNKDRPFFLYLPHSMPHVPLGVSAKFRGKSAQGMYGDVIMEIDWSVGQVLQEIQRLGLDDRTLLIFASDNGPWLNFGNHAGSAGPLREGKGTAWEGGVRVPCIMRWPGRIPAGSVCNGMAATIDLLPTIASITGSTLPSREIDGVDILSLMEGRRNVAPRREFFYYYEGELHAVRSGKWKLHFPHGYRSYVGVTPGKDGVPGPYASGTTALALYDLENDIGERTNVAAEHPDIVSNLKELGEEARQTLGDRITGKQGYGVRPPGRRGPARDSVRLNMAQGKSIAIRNRYSPRYPARGEETLVDRIRGSLDFTDGAWLGLEGVDLDATIDLGSPETIRRVSLGCLESQGSWIFLPSLVEISVSRDGERFELVHSSSAKVESFDPVPRIKEFSATCSAPASVRYVRVSARNIGNCPDWHPGAGGKAWLFVDEIVVE